MINSIMLATSGTSVLVVPWWHWVTLLGWFGVLITLDVAVLHKKDHAASIKSASLQTLAWITLGIALGGVIWAVHGGDAGAEYFSGFVIEKSLSIDNVFVWSIILSYFAIPDKYQHRVLFWGVFGALIMRAAFIFGGITLIEHFEWTLIILGIFLLWTGYKVGTGGEDDEFDPASSKGIALIRRVVPVTDNLDGHKLFTHENGHRVATMLFVALCAVELTDVFFAVDSVPAILAVARDPFIVFASNAAAILGLRALYFVFDALKDKFTLLNKGLGIILSAVGVKMIIGPEKIFGVNWFGIHINTWLSLAFILAVLIVSIVASILTGETSDEDCDKEPEATYS
jgi:tellurite resistance protein TerC